MKRGQLGLTGMRFFMNGFLQCFSEPEHEDYNTIHSVIFLRCATRGSVRT